MGKVQVTQAHISGSNVHVKAAADGSAVPGTTKIFLSLGSASNGFQYSIALREEIMAKKNWNDVACLGDKAFLDFSFVIHSPPKIVSLAVDP